MRSFEPIAIVGLGGLFPGAADLDQFWANISAGVDASSEVPDGRWCLPPESIHDPRPGMPDCVVSTRGYFLDPFTPDLQGLRFVAPVDELDVLLQLALHVGNRAWASARTDSLDRSRVGVILGSIALPTDRISDMVREIVSEGSSSVHPLNREVTGLPARLLADALGLGGTAFTLDAACASSLYALKLACDELHFGRADAMLAGGLSRPDCLYTQMGFSQLRALSPTGRCSPFDAKGNGLVVGEGGGVFVLKRLRDAEAHDDTIHGVITGIGLSNDIEGNLLAPASEGQLRAMRAAYAMAGIRPDDVDLIECHATGTPVGDAVEFNSLRQLWSEAERGRTSAIGSVKASVGHLLTGANAAGLMKVLLAMRHETLPPATNFALPAKGVEMAGSPFRLLDRAQPWTANGPRRAAVSGFGFGGINAHLIVEEYSEPLAASPSSPARMATPQVAVVAVASRKGRLSDIHVGANEFPVPPLELPDMLPQQLLLMQVAREALHADGSSNTGVFIGIETDIRTTFFHLRWWAQQHGLSADEASPPLTANRTMGALASIAASRVARMLRCGGPSFTVSAGDESGGCALAIALDQLRTGEIDRAIIGATQFRDDPISTGVSVSRDAAVVLVVKRRDDAERDGDSILAMIEEQSYASPRFNESRWGPAERLMVIADDCLSGRSTMDLAVAGRSCKLTSLGQRKTPELPGPAAVTLIAAESASEFIKKTRELHSLCDQCQDAVSLAAEWHRRNQRPDGRFRQAIVGQDLATFRKACDEMQPVEVGEPPPLAFVYPGSGNHFHGMGLTLSGMFPEIVERQRRESRTLDAQYADQEFWDGERPIEPHPRSVLFAQVSLGTLVTDLVRSFGIEPNAVIGYSLGESASLFGMRAWTARDEMYERLQRSTLFTSDLAPPYNSARTQWNLPGREPIDWLTGVLAAPAEVVEKAIRPGSHAYVLIVNTLDECVIGGLRPDVDALIRDVGRPFVEVRGVTAAHCDVAQPVRDSYWKLHHLPVTPVPGVTWYSGATGEPYDLSSDHCADAITAAVLHRIDFPRVIERAYADGVRTFVEIGPGASCSRMISRILNGRPHEVVPLVVKKSNPLGTLLAALGRLHLFGHEINPGPLYERGGATPQTVEGPKISISVRPFVPRLEPLPMPVILDTPSTFVDASRIYEATGQAHEAFLRFTTSTFDRLSETIALQTRLLQSGAMPQPAEELSQAADDVPRSLSLEDCFEFAVGRIGNVLGLRYAEIDTFPTRVRLPDGPLMLVDRILRIDGEPLSMGGGRVITEHVVHPDRWYLDAGRIPTCVAVEAGQADLFLSGFLGIDFITRGLAAYRLLDASITLHGPLPIAGETIRYDILIDHFFRQGDTHLFRFRFEGTVNGRPLLSMTDGCAGFFSAEALAGGKGIVQTELDRRPMPGKLPDDWYVPAPMIRETLAAEQINALREGDLVGAFGSAFASLRLRNPQRLPGGMLKLIDRVVEIDPTGGRFGLGLIRAEADIHADDWFLTCHFVDDMVMPGTLMYECCLHTLRVFLMRMGWVGEEGQIISEPVPGIASKLKCRGQVTAETRIAAYEVTIKELGYGPEPFAIADALMYADGRPIVEMTNMSLRLTGLSREAIDSLWSSELMPMFDRDRITAFAIGKPSEAFGEPYRIFDEERVIARLPGPPFQFLDRIMRIEAEQWKMQAGGRIVAEYDVPAKEWYFDRNAEMPFCVLLEVALQPCGWLAAYVGSALTSPVDMSFRNLGGKAVQHRPVRPDVGMLSIAVTLTRVSNSAGMVIQHYDYEVSDASGPIYTGDTYFGFFTKQALVNQVGLREANLLKPPTVAAIGKFPAESPYPAAMLRMVDKITWFVADGGPAGQGAIEGSIRVDPSAWFFKAHFHQDPVWPGSLGLESFTQLARHLAATRWGVGFDEVRMPAAVKPHRWVYRGQVLPTDAEVTVQAWVTACDDDARVMTCAGLLSVDGRIIYQMDDFVISPS